MKEDGKEGLFVRFLCLYYRRNKMSSYFVDKHIPRDLAIHRSRVFGAHTTLEGRLPSCVSCVMPQVVCVHQIFEGDVQKGDEFVEIIANREDKIKTKLGC